MDLTNVSVILARNADFTNMQKYSRFKITVINKIYYNFRIFDRPFINRFIRRNSRIRKKKKELVFVVQV